MSVGPSRSKVINDNLIEEIYWHGDFIVYVNHRSYDGTFEEAVNKYEKQVIPRRWKHGKDRKAHI